MAEYILKQAALDALQSEGITRNMKAYKKVQDIQAADVNPVQHGRRINVYISGIRHYRCSRCGGYTEAVFDYNYCPDCGAKMDG